MPFTPLPPFNWKIIRRPDFVLKALSTRQFAYLTVFTLGRLAWEWPNWLRGEHKLGRPSGLCTNKNLGYRNSGRAKF